MKKIISALFVIIFVFSGCSIGSGKISLNKIAAEYLCACSVTGSTIDTIDYDAVSSYDCSSPTRNLTYISESIDDFLEFAYDSILSSNGIIENGDVVEFKLELLNESGEAILTDENAKLLIGMGCLDKETEENLIGNTLNGTYTFDASDGLKTFYNVPTAEKAVITPVGIYQYIENDNTSVYLSKNGFTDFNDLYKYFFDSELEAQAAEANTEAKESFMNYVIENCTFTVSNDDLNSFAEIVPKQNSQPSDDSDTPIDEYAFTAFGSDSVKYKIEKCLAIGALSQHFKIDIDDDDIKEFCSEYDLDYSDSATASYAGYLSLEQLVISEFIQLLIE